MYYPMTLWLIEIAFMLRRRHREARPSPLVLAVLQCCPLECAPGLGGPANSHDAV